MPLKILWVVDEEADFQSQDGKVNTYVWGERTFFHSISKNKGGKNLLTAWREGVEMQEKTSPWKSSKCSGSLYHTPVKDTKSNHVL